MSSPDSRRNSRNSRFGQTENPLHLATQDAFSISSGATRSTRKFPPGMRMLIFSIEQSQDRFFRACIYSARTRTADNRADTLASEINWYFNLAIRMCHRPLIYLSLPADLPPRRPINLFRRAADPGESLSINCSGPGPSPRLNGRACLQDPCTALLRTREHEFRNNFVYC